MGRWALGGCVLAFAAPLAGQQPDSADRSAGPVPIEPAGWVKAADFPRAASARGLHGAVRFVLAIDAGGTVYRCDIVRSSGVPALDQQSCALMLVRGKFRPALDRAGAAVPGEWSRRISWGQPGGADVESDYDAIINVRALPSRKKSASVAVRELLSADGTREACAVERTSGDADLDQQACALVAQVASAPPLKAADATPVRGMRVRRIGFFVGRQ